MHSKLFISCAMSSSHSLLYRPSFRYRSLYCAAGQDRLAYLIVSPHHQSVELPLPHHIRDIADYQQKSRSFSSFYAFPRNQIRVRPICYLQYNIIRKNCESWYPIVILTLNPGRRNSLYQIFLHSQKDQENRNQGQSRHSKHGPPIGTGRWI